MTARKRILFVCSGNICRSPFAEAAARQRYGHLHDFASAGTVAVLGDAATPHMQDVAEEFGLDLSHHRAQPASSTAQPDMVFGMEHVHLAAAKRIWPDMDKGTIQLLDHPHAVPDPYGHGIDAYRASAEHILRALDAVPFD